MDSRRNLIIFIAVLVIGAAAALIETQRAANRRPPLVDTASIGAPVAPATRIGSSSAHPPQSTSTPPPPNALFPTAPVTQQTQAPASQSDLVAATPTAPSSTPTDTTDRDADLRNSQHRLNAIDSLAENADRLFATPELPDDFGSRSTNPQGLDQLDYQTPEGNITTWSSEDENGNPVTRAQEAQLANGELVDRWFSDDGKVEQIMHQYDRDNSYSVYYYSTGEVEATRVVRNGSEIFTKYDRDGRQIERTQTPAAQ